MGRRTITLVLAGLLFVLGIGVLTFPYLAQWQYTRQAERVIASYRREVDALGQPGPGSGTDPARSAAGYLDDLYAKMQAYNKGIYQSGQSALTDPFSYQQPSFDLTEFGFDENVVGYLEIPVMEVKLPIYLGATAENMAKGAVHLTQTSLPIGGKHTNCVLAAHRGMSTAAMFRGIEKLEIGDELTVTNFRETLTYRVAQIKVIYPDQLEEILIQPGRDLITLLSCHPYGHNYQRYAVYCERVKKPFETGDAYER